MKLEEQDYPEYDRCLTKAKLELSIPPAPEMPTFVNNPLFQAGLSKSEAPGRDCRRRPELREHQDNFAAVGDASIEQWCMIHKQVPIPEAMRIPKAKAALDEEWSKLQDELKAWDLSKVRPRKEVMAEAEKLRKRLILVPLWTYAI